MDGRRNFSSDPDAGSRWYPDGRGYDERGYDDRGDRGRDEAEREYGDDRGYTPTRYADEREYDDGGYRVPEPRGGGRGYGGEAPGYGDDPSGQFGASALGRGGDSGEYSGEFVSRSRRSEAIDRSALQRPVSGGGGSGSIPGLTGTGSSVQGLPTVTPTSTGALGAAAATGFGGGSGPAPVAPPGFEAPGVSAPGFGAAGAGSPGFGAAATSGPGFGAGGASGPVSGGPISGVPGSGAPAGAEFGPGGPGSIGAVPSAFAGPTALTAAVPAPRQYGAGADAGGAVYQSKRPGLAVALVVLTVLFEVPVLRVFLHAVTASEAPAGGTLAGTFMIPALPMFALGLYGLIGGAAAAAPGVRVWLRTPLAYLPVALLLFVAAGLAA